MTVHSLDQLIALDRFDPRHRPCQLPVSLRTHVRRLSRFATIRPEKYRRRGRLVTAPSRIRRHSVFRSRRVSIRAATTARRQRRRRTRNGTDDDDDDGARRAESGCRDFSVEHGPATEAGREGVG